MTASGGPGSGPTSSQRTCRPIGPVLGLAVVPFLPGDGPGANVGLFTFALGWLLHIATDRALGYGLRTADGRQR